MRLDSASLAMRHTGIQLPVQSYFLSNSRDSNSLPLKYQGVPKGIVPYLQADLEDQGDAALIRASEGVNYKAFEAFNKNPTKNTLEAALYILLADIHHCYYPWNDMFAFRNQVQTYPDCGYVAGRIRKVMDHYGHTSSSLWFVNGAKDAQFTTVLKAKGKYFAIDHASWYYGPQDSPWFYVMEANSIRDAVEKLEDYFKTKTRPSDTLDYSKWKLREREREIEIAKRFIEGDLA